MQITGIVTAVEFDVQITKKDGGQYPGARFTYRDSAGKIGEQAFHNNALKYNAGLKTQLGNLVNGSGFVMEKEKDGDFWKVTSILPASTKETETINYNNQSAAGAKPTASPKSTYETADERAEKQVYIVRQSSISNAIAYHGDATLAKVESILKTAKTFENYVFGIDANTVAENKPVIKKDVFEDDHDEVFNVQ